LLGQSPGNTHKGKALALRYAEHTL
jgi:hypothetical protein